ncbi:MAG: deoxyribodipyrimidine photo-lyase [Salinarimonadaceae bacterium]|nr:MAG: deoxyribodipyrimidine photo-lyase [Salinarimonadaceae bacterium]
MSRPALVWFREDFRIGDNPALTAAIESGRSVFCVYVHDALSPEIRAPGGASRWWLHGSLDALRASLRAIGGDLLLFRGRSRDVIPRIVEAAGCAAVFWNRRYGPERAIDVDVKAGLKRSGVSASSFSSRLVVEPGDVRTQAGGSFKVFTPFHKASLTRDPPPPPLPAPDSIVAATIPAELAARTVALEDLDLEPRRPDWAGGLRESWERGETGARKRLSSFLENGFAGYAGDRNRPDLDMTSRLSPHLRFGELSARSVVHAARFALEASGGSIAREDYDVFRAEIGWRDFSYLLLFENDNLASGNLQKNFDAFPWREDEAAVDAWRKGRTGYPIVDAGMRQLWRTGFMHNRVRMIVASFLIKHLLIDWRVGEEWFWDTLVDADAANNPASWQWVAGSGADAAPYYRIFNPVTQGERFDPNGDYVRAWVPELAGMPSRMIHRPWEAAPSVLHSARVQLGESYPKPIVVHEVARKRALSAFESIRSRRS